MNERLLNKKIQPNVVEMASYCGKNAKNFITFNSFLSKKYNTIQEIRFPYGKDYGWCITHREGTKLICNVFAEADSFTVMVRLSNQQFDLVYNDVDQYSKDLIDTRYPCGNGGWIHYRVSSDNHLKAIQKILSYKN
ncbi:DUF3788 family protein [Enterococcus sp. HY326]|uniref:DUF3788 family protein n=1 Tax=Enterococcus sp. HY326 TaxID=2971265 RepID=UPI00223F8E7C|nr:DUF3788 family protein [Enterococcus sp. HY326]